MTPEELAKLRILLVDDEKFICNLVQRMLMDLGYRSIATAGDGKEGLHTLVSASPPIDVVILDLEMPEIDGMDFLRYVRNDPATPDHEVPVVVLTGHADMENIQKAAAIGIHGFLVKPVSKAHLDKQIRRALEGIMIDPTKLSG